MTKGKEMCSKLLGSVFWLCLTFSLTSERLLFPFLKIIIFIVTACIFVSAHVCVCVCVCVCACVCVWTHAMVHMYGTEDNIQKSVLSLYHGFQVLNLVYQAWCSKCFLIYWVVSLPTISLILKDLSESSMVVHTCYPSSWKLRQQGGKFDASLATQ